MQPAFVLPQYKPPYIASETIMNGPAMTKPTALIFDMDGVLIDSEPLHERSKREALSQAGIEVPEERFASYTGRSDTVMINDLAAENGIGKEESQAILRSKHTIYESLEHELEPIEGAVDFLHWAKPRFRLALATSANARNRQKTAEMLGIAPLFEVAVDASNFEHPKPSPEVFLIALEKLGLPADSCWVVEDAINGVLAAKAAGCFAVGLTTSFSREALEEAGADMVIENFAELQHFLESL